MMEPSVRAGDADRRRVVEQLQQHYVDGRLSSDELSERVDQALAARTFGELSQLIEDLPQPETARAEAGVQQQWWSPFVRMPGVLLVAMVALLVLVWVAWLPQGGFVAAPALLLGGVFIFNRR